MPTVLKLGARGPEVGNLQRVLNALGYYDHADQELADDEAFGQRTHAALIKFQDARNHELSGALDLPTRIDLAELGFVPFTAAKHQTILWPHRRRPTLVVIHTAECREADPNAAENLASWDAGTFAPQASWHYAVDRNSVTQSVRDTDEAWHANQANGRGIGIEHAGFAAQTAAEWADADSSAILLRSAGLLARLARRWSIPLVRLTPQQILAGLPGICGHADVNVAYQNKGGHTDPGPSFPWTEYLALALAHG